MARSLLLFLCEFISKGPFVLGATSEATAAPSFQGARAQPSRADQTPSDGFAALVDSNASTAAVNGQQALAPDQPPPPSRATTAAADHAQTRDTSPPGAAPASSPAESDAAPAPAGDTAIASLATARHHKHGASKNAAKAEIGAEHGKPSADSLLELKASPSSPTQNATPPDGAPAAAPIAVAVAAAVPVALTDTPAVPGSAAHSTPPGPLVIAAAAIASSTGAKDESQPTGAAQPPIAQGTLAAPAIEVQPSRPNLATAALSATAAAPAPAGVPNPTTATTAETPPASATPASVARASATPASVTPAPVTANPVSAASPDPALADGAARAPAVAPSPVATAAAVHDIPTSTIDPPAGAAPAATSETAQPAPEIAAVTLPAKRQSTVLGSQPVIADPSSVASPAPPPEHIAAAIHSSAGVSNKPDDAAVETAKPFAPEATKEPVAAALTSPHHDHVASNATTPSATSPGTGPSTAIPQFQSQPAGPPAAVLPLNAVAVTSGVAVPLNGLAIEIAVTAQSGKSRFEIRLDPAELGRIDVRLDVDRHGQVTSHLTVERPETLAMLRQDAPQLQRALEHAGLKTGDGGLQFSLRDQSSSQQRDNNDSTRNVQRLVVSEDDAVPVQTVGRSYGRMLQSRSGIDIRV